jgi:hypothetical protein
MDANSGEPWSEMDITDLKHALAYGDTFAQTASMLCRDLVEVRQKARELGLTEHPGRASGATCSVETGGRGLGIQGR